MALKKDDLCNSFKKETLLQPKATSFDFELLKNDCVLAVCDDSTIKLIDSKTGVVKNVLCDVNTDEDVTKPSIICWHVFQNSLKLLTVDSTLIMQIWDIESGKSCQVWKAPHKRIVSCFDVDNASILVATGSSDKFIKVYDLTKRMVTHSFTVPVGLVRMIKFYGNSSDYKIVSTHDDWNIRLFNLNQRSLLACFQSHKATISGIAKYEDEMLLLSTGRDFLINVWNIEDLTCVITFKHDKDIMCAGAISKKAVSKLGYKKKSTFAYICTCDGAIEILKLTPVSRLYSFYPFNEPKENLINFAKLSVKGDSIYCMSENMDFMKYSIQKECLTYQFPLNMNEIIDIKFINSNKFVIAATGDVLRIFKLVDGRLYCDQVLSGHTDTIMTVQVSIDEKIIVSGGKDENAIVWQLNEETNLYKLWCIGQSHIKGVNAIAISTSDYGSYVVLSGGVDKTVKKWQIIAGDMNLSWTNTFHKKVINCLCISPDFTIGASASSDKSICVFRMDGQKLAILTGHKRSVNTIAFSTTDQLLVSGSLDKNIMLWNLSSYTCIKSLSGHNNGITCVKFLNKGRQILSSSTDAQLKVWNVHQNKNLCTLENHEEKIWNFDVMLDSSDNLHNIISGDAGGNVILWKDDTAEKYRLQQELVQNEILSKQKLENLLYEKNYSEALYFAVTLKKGAKLFGIVEDILKSNPVLMLLSSIKEALGRLNMEEAASVIKMASEWNKNTRKYLASQILLRCLIEVYGVEFLCNCDISNFEQYSSRHFKRVDKLLQESYIFSISGDKMSLESEN